MASLKTNLSDLKLPENPEDRNQAFWESVFNETNFPGMDLMEVHYFGLEPETQLESYKLFRRISKDFIRYLGYHYVMDLRAAGISEEGIFYIKKGILPENYTVHLKYPLHYGGSIDFNNMVLMQSHPFHDLIHTYVAKQILTDTGVSFPEKLYVPTPVGRIYIPLTSFTGSGGKGKHDRSVYAGFSQSAFKEIAIKNMPGR